MTVPSRPGQQYRPPPRHQRRVLVGAAELLRPGASGALVAACLRWQEEYLAGLHVMVPDPHPNGSPPLVVDRLLRAGLSPWSVTFFRAGGITGLDELHGLLDRTAAGYPDHPDDQDHPDHPDHPGRFPASGRAARIAATEILAVGATHVAGAAAQTVRAARAMAVAANRLLGAAEFAVPDPVDGQALRVTAPDPAARQGPGPRCATSELAAALLAEGARRVARECEQRIELFADLRSAASCGAGVGPCAARRSSTPS